MYMQCRTSLRIVHEQYLNGPKSDKRARTRLPTHGYRHMYKHKLIHLRNVQCDIYIYTAGPQTGVVLDVSPRTAMCVRNVDVQMCPAVHTMTRS